MAMDMVTGQSLQTEICSLTTLLNGAIQTMMVMAITQKVTMETFAPRYTESRSYLALEVAPDTDGDGVVDPYDAFPDDYFQQTDSDGDGWGDNPGYQFSDDCPDQYGTSNYSGLMGCPDADGDLHADTEDAFPEDPLQWEDTDGDGWGDNYGWVNKTIADEVDIGMFIIIREQWGDAFITDSSQWSDIDGDGYGDNETGRVPDAFPVRSSQHADSDGDGYGDSQVLDSFQSDGCKTEYGESYIDYFGCPDADKDGVSDKTDPCPYDSSVYLGIRGSVECEKFDDEDGDGIPDLYDQDYVGSVSDEEGFSDELFILVGLIVFLLAIITVAMVAKQSFEEENLRSTEQKK